jgi:hypothetical protein
MTSMMRFEVALGRAPAEPTPSNSKLSSRTAAATPGLLMRRGVYVGSSKTAIYDVESEAPPSA